MTGELFFVILFMLLGPPVFLGVLSKLFGLGFWYGFSVGLVAIGGFLLLIMGAQ
jgi:hypothetical protein